MRHFPTAALPRAAAEVAARAREHLVAGRELLPLLDPLGALCVRVLFGLYEDLLALMEERRFDVFRERPRLTDARKWTGLAATCLYPRNP